MSAGSSGEDSGGEPAPPRDPWSQPADFGQPGSPATPQTPEPAGFSSAAPQDWSASWSDPESAPTAPPIPPTQSAPTAPPAQSAPTSQPTQPPPPGPSAFTPPPWPGSTDASASQQSAGNGFSTAGSNPWTGQPPGYSQPGGPYGPPAAAYYAPATVRTNPVAIAALVCGIAQVLGFVVLLGNILLAVPAVICGGIALRQINARGERGRGMAIAGVVLGIIGIVLFVLFLGLVILAAVSYRGFSSPG